MGLGLATNDVHVFQTGTAIESKIGQVLAKKPEAFAKKKNRDQRQHNDRNQGVAPEESLNRCFGTNTTAARLAFLREDRHPRGDCFHTIDDAKHHRGQQRL